MSSKIRFGPSAAALLAAAIVAAAPPPGASARDAISSIIENGEAVSRPLWARLAEFDRARRENAILDVEVGSVATEDDRALAELIADLWNAGRFEGAIGVLRALEARGLPIAVGVSWKEPVPVAGDGRGEDARVGAPHFWAKQTSLEGGIRLFAAVVWDYLNEWGWSMNMSEDDGATWVETYYRSTNAEILDLDTAWSSNWVWVGCVWGGDPMWPKMSRFDNSDGSFDNGYGSSGVFEVYNSAPATVEEVGVEILEYIFPYWGVVNLFAIQSDGQLRRFEQDLLYPSSLYQEIPTYVGNAAGGLDTAYLFAASYIGTDGGVYVLCLPTTVYHLEQFTGTHEHTSIAAAEDSSNRTIYGICAAEHDYPNGQGVKCWLSVDSGSSWSPSALVYPGPGEGEYMMPAVAASAEGYAAVYQQETGAFDQVFFTNKPGLQLGEWWQDPVPVNEWTVHTGSPLEINNVAPIFGEESYAYGILYITQHPQYWLTWPLFDRSPGPGGYCHAWAATYQSPHISNVSLGSINHSSGMSYGGYGEHTDHSTNMAIGTAHELTVTAADSLPTDECGAWIDWNQDLDFDDADETISVSGSPGEGPYTATIVPPGEAVLGETRMRIRVTRDGPPTPCGSGGRGEVEDYAIVVTPGYCAASAVCDSYIQRVQLDDLDNTSACEDGYSDYTHLAAEIVLGSANEITITIGNSAGYEYGAVFIDWNQDLVFGYPSEEVPLTGSPGPGPYTGAVIHPPDAVPGPTRMRVRVSGEEDPPGPCGPTETGEVEDYTINVVESPYCQAFSECDEYISRVQLGDIDNTSACAFGWFGYSDYTGLSTELAIGTGTPITITIELGEAGDEGGLWIDWNQDLDFEDAEETITLTGSPGSGPYTGTVSPPPDATLGATRMRVRVVRDHAPEPCGEQDAGEVEDYTVIVIETPPCPADVNGDGIVDVLDLLALLAAWGNAGGPEDINGDGIVDVLDLLELLAAWGPC